MPPVPLTIVLQNQFGETSINEIMGGTNPDASTPIATHTFLANTTGGTATPAATSYEDAANALANDMGAALDPADITGKALTGLVAGTNTPIADTDTILEGMQNLQGQLTSAAITGKVLTGLATGAASTILSTDTILEALAKLQAQIDAL